MSSSPSKHSPLSPSGSKTWLSCTASIGFIAKNRDRLPAGETSSRYADEGTEAHLYASQLLLGKKNVPVPKSTEMVACIRDGYVPHILDRQKRIGAKLRVEHNCKLFYDSEQFGTCDAPLLGAKAAEFWDLKYGAGISVEAKFNSQLAIYAESTLQELWPKCPDETPLVLGIYQPRAQDNRFVRKWELTRGQLAEFCERIEETALDIMVDPNNQKFVPEADTTCRFCPAKPICTAYAVHLLEDVPVKELKLVESRLSLPIPSELTSNQLIRFVRVKGDLLKWIESIEEYLVPLLRSGKLKTDLLKLVASKTNREWTDDKKAEELLGELLDADEVRPPRIVSPSAAQKLLASLKIKPTESFIKKLGKLVTKPEGHPVLALKEDPRPPLDSDAASDFDVISDADSTML